MELNETSASHYVMVFALTCTLNALPQAELQARQSGEYLAGQIGIVQTGRLLLIHQVSQQWKAHQRLLLPTEASTNNTPLIALENLSSLIMLRAEAAHADKTARREEASAATAIRCRRLSIKRAFCHTSLHCLPLCIPRQTQVFGALCCRAPTLMRGLPR